MHTPLQWEKSEIKRVLTVRGTFTDETDAVSAVEIIPVGVMDKPSAVLALFVSVSPVIRLARLPLSESSSMKNTSTFKKHVFISYIQMITDLL